MLDQLPVKTLVILNDAPYGTERSYNALRLAGSLLKQPDQAVKIFLIGDAAACAHSGQHVPNGYYNIETMLRTIAAHGSDIGVCSTCMDARGMTDEHLAEGTRRSSLRELTTWTIWADKVLVF